MEFLIYFNKTLGKCNSRKGQSLLAHGLSGAAHHAEEGKEVWLLCLLLSKLLGQAQFPGPMGLEAACSP